MNYNGGDKMKACLYYIMEPLGIVTVQTMSKVLIINKFVPLGTHGMSSPVRKATRIYLSCNTSISSGLLTRYNLF